MSFPEERPRRLRRTERLRAMVRETRVSPANLVYPLFVVPGAGCPEIDVTNGPFALRTSTPSESTTRLVIESSSLIAC